MKTTKKQRKAARGMNHATREAFHRLGQTPEYGRFTRRRRLTLIQRANIHRIQYINPRNWGAW